MGRTKPFPFLFLLAERYYPCQFACTREDKVCKTSHYGSVREYTKRSVTSLYILVETHFLLFIVQGPMRYVFWGRSSSILALLVHRCREESLL